MDPLAISLAIALGTGISTVFNKLVEKGVLEPGLEPAIEQLKSFIQSGYRERQKQQAIRAAYDRAVEDALAPTALTDAQQHQFRVGIARIAQPSNEGARDEVIRLTLLASNPDAALGVSDELLGALNLQPVQRSAMALFLYHLRQNLAGLDPFKSLFRIAATQNVENWLRTLGSTVTTAGDGLPAVRVVTVDPAWPRERYLEFLVEDFRRLRLETLDERLTLAKEKPITLDEVYTDLDVEETFTQDEEGHPIFESVRWQGGKPFVRGDARRLTALEAVSDAAQPRIVLLGAPGSGKSTFINYLGFCLASEQLEPGSPDGLARLAHWALGALFPVRIILRELVAWADENSLHQATERTVWDFVRYQLGQQDFEADFAFLKKHSQQQGGLVLLDGLDEVREADARREFIKEAIESFARANRKCRILVTCRPYAYAPPAAPGQPDWRLAGFNLHTLALFSPEQIEQFIHAFYQSIRRRQGLAEAQMEKQIESLAAAAREPRLARIAEQPLLLTLMALLHAANGQLPRDRADLYTRIVHLLVHRWQSNREVFNRAVQEDKTGALAKAFDGQLLENALGRVACEAHRRQGAAASPDRVKVADIRREDLVSALKPALNNSDDRANVVIDYLQERAGLLLWQDARTFTFPHRTFQEFMAAWHLVRKSKYFPKDIATDARLNRVWWGEVYLLAASLAAQGRYGMGVSVIEALCDSDFASGSPISEEEAYASLLAAQAAVEIRLRAECDVEPELRETLNRLQAWLVAIMQQGVLPLADRAEAGRTLRALGDPRPDVVCPIPALVAVPAGEFTMGTSEKEAQAVIERYGGNWKDWVKDEMPQHRVKLKAYRIGKYPVTNAQYRCFVEDGGYTEKWRACWTEAGWQWRRENRLEKSAYWDDPHWNLDNHPVVGVSWYEAVAYCSWLTKTDPERRTFRLPTEAEWEKAARGEDGREYPWLGEFDSEKANADESGIVRTTAVGLFPRGSSPHGALDMAGNVREWCSSLYQAYPYRATDGREDLNAGDARVMRGGSWVNVAIYARCANRDGDNPEGRYWNVGFRIAESALPPSGSDS